MDITVVKIGGNIIDDTATLAPVLRAVASLPSPKILVHGGGALATTLQRQLGLPATLRDGRRVTDAATLRVVTMVYAGWCNKTIVAQLQGYGCAAVGLSGADGNVIPAMRRPPVPATKEGQAPLDYGFVGDVDPKAINVPFLLSLLAAGCTPVLCAITHDGHGTLLNTNADTIAASVATALAATAQVSLIYCFEKEGVLYDAADDSSVLATLTPTLYSQLKDEGRISAGMLPKVETAFAALRAGVATVTIKHARHLLDTTGTVLTL